MENNRNNYTPTKKQFISFFLPGSIIVFAVILAFGLNSEKASKSDAKAIENDEAEIQLTFKTPVNRDMDAIRRDGTLRMITRFNSSSYFIYKGEQRGFEYELAKAFADQHGLNLEVVVAQGEENPLDLLNSGRGDFIAANYSITPERQKYAKFSRPYNVVDQVLVFGTGSHIPESLEDLNNVTISVRKGSSYFKTLRRLQREGGYTFRINALPEIWDTEAILYALADGDFEATVTDANLLASASSYINGLRTGPVLSSEDEIAWAVRSNSNELISSMNEFIGTHFWVSDTDLTHRRSAFMNVLKRRYFDNRPAAYNVRNYAMRTGYEGLVSPYDNLVKPLADSAGIDWKLVIAVMSQESRFDPYAKSWAGAVGLMQIMPRFSLVEHEEDLFIPEVNIREGIRFLKKHMNHYAYMDSTNQIAFSLAAYNVGMGHMADARRLAMDHNKNPNDWNDVSDALLKLMHPHYYSSARHGYARGIETVNYVRSVMNRYQMYHTLMMFANEDPLRDRLDPVLSAVENSK
jgi:membrane-bound lytic murein transglycosylase F